MIEKGRIDQPLLERLVCRENRISIFGSTSRLPWLDSVEEKIEVLMNSESKYKEPYYETILRINIWRESGSIIVCFGCWLGTASKPFLVTLAVKVLQIMVSRLTVVTMMIYFVLMDRMWNYDITNISGHICSRQCFITNWHEYACVALWSSFTRLL